MSERERLNDLIKCLIKNYNITESQLFGLSRVAHVAEARQVFSYCIRKKLHLSFPVIGSLLNRDHTTIMHACNKIEKEINNNQRLKGIVDNCLNSNLNFFPEEKEDKVVEEVKSIKKIEFEVKEEKNKKVELPKFKQDTFQYSFPIQFNDGYIDSLLSKVENRRREILKQRYGLFHNEFHTLEEISIKNGITRERVRQLVLSALKNIYIYNHGGIQQILYKIAKNIEEKRIVLIQDICKEIYLFDKKNKAQVIKIILIFITLIPSIKKFEFNEEIFLINKENEAHLFKIIDKIKNKISLIYENINDSVVDKWDYVYSEFKKNNNSFDKTFIKACYDNYLFESEIIIRGREDINKYNLSHINKDVQETEGVPKEYEIFFK